MQTELRPFRTATKQICRQDNSTNFNVPYDFINDDSISAFVDDLKGMIKFLEENIGDA